MFASKVIANQTYSQQYYLKILSILIFSVIGIQLSGCAAIHTSIKKKDLDVQTKMSETIFLEPVNPAHKIIFVDIRNTSDKDLSVDADIRASLTSRGYTITANPDQANFMLQANILKVGKADLRDAEGALNSGFGGAVAGAAIAGASGSSSKGVAGAGLLGAIIGTAADALVDDVYFTMITDLQIRERPRQGEQVTQSQTTNASQGTSTVLNQQVSGGVVNWKTYRTRIVSTANKVNLEFEEALPPLMKGLTRSVSGVF